MPTTSGKVPAAVAEVEERKAYWLKKRAEAKETGIVMEERDEAGPSKPKANGGAKGGGRGNTLDLTAELWPGESSSPSLPCVCCWVCRAHVEGRKGRGGGRGSNE